MHTMWVQLCVCMCAHMAGLRASYTPPRKWEVKGCYHKSPYNPPLFSLTITIFHFQPNHMLVANRGGRFVKLPLLRVIEKRETSIYVGSLPVNDPNRSRIITMQQAYVDEKSYTWICVEPSGKREEESEKEIRVLEKDVRG